MHYSVFFMFKLPCKFMSHYCNWFSIITQFHYFISLPMIMQTCFTGETFFGYLVTARCFDVGRGLLYENCDIHFSYYISDEFLSIKYLLANH